MEENKMTVEKLADEILNAVGGTKNIDRMTHCITRLRFNIKNQSIVKDDKIKKIDGVLGTVNQSGQYQIIIGDEVEKVYDLILEKLNKNQSTNSSIDPGKHKKANLFGRIIDSISSILSPLIPPLAAAGMLKVILLILSMTNILSTKGNTYITLNFISDSVFYFMPLLVAYAASVKFKCNSVLAIVLAGVLLHPTFTALIGKEGASLSVFGLPIPLVKYNATVLPTLLMVWFMSYVERFAEKISPKPIKVFFKPLVVMLIVAPITLVIIAPIGNAIGNYLATIFTYLLDKQGWLAVALLSSVYPTLVMVGMHRALTPIGLSLYNSLGYEPLLKAASLCSNFSQASACVAVAIKSKNKELKQIAFSAATTAFIGGITEPAMYGVTLKLKRPFIACMISGAVAGIYAGITALKAYAYATPSIFSFAMFMGPESNNIIHAIITAAIAIVGAFALTWILGFEDPVDESSNPTEEKGAENEVNRSMKTPEYKIYAPVSGNVINLREVNDETFAKEMCGKGVAIQPLESTFLSPVDGIVEVVFKTKHAIGFKSDDGVQVMLHIGIDTVNLEGKYFDVLVEEHSKVTKGQPIVKIDMEKIKGLGYDLTTCVIVTNTNDYLDVIETDAKEVKTGDKLISVLESNL